MLTLTWGIDILFEKLTLEIGAWNWETPFALYTSRDWDFTQNLSLLKIFSGNLHLGLC